MSRAGDGSDGPDRVSAEVLRLLEEFGESAGNKLTEAIRNLEDSHRGQARTARARGLLDGLAAELRRLVPQEQVVELYEARHRDSTRSTAACHRLQAAVQHVQRARHEAARQEDQRRRLEWLQLASILDDRPVRVGAYQAHVERFWGRAVQEMQALFPWTTVQVSLFANRRRTDGSKGELARAFADQAVDYMLVPQDHNPGGADSGLRCYTYSLRLVGPRTELRRMGDGSGRTVPIERLRDKVLIAAPSGFSSRERLDSCLRTSGVVPAAVLEDESPLMLRVRALAGEGLAVLSDEYTAVGGQGQQYPRLRVAGNRTYTIDMHVLRRPTAQRGVHEALDFVLQRLVEREQAQERAAALD